MKVKIYSSEPAQWREVATVGPYISCEDIECKLSDNCEGCFFKSIYKDSPMSTVFLKDQGVLKHK